jgi:Raf kinase inhibitor-like YbhB/YbcL family protein
MAQHHPTSSGAALTLQKVQAQQAGRLRLASEAIGPDGRIDRLSSGYEDNLSPPLEWTGMPEAQTYALVVEDPDAPTDLPVLHWLIWNIPGTLTALPRGVPDGAHAAGLGGAVQGRNSLGGHGYMGPKPPPGDSPHRYHFQLFALDLTLDISPQTPLAEMVNILKGHAIADAELVGLYACDETAPAPRTFISDEDRGGLDQDDIDRHAPHDADGVVRER